MFDLSKELEETALRDPYFVERKLYPNVDFYSGIIYGALGIPTQMFTVMFALGRLPGWDRALEGDDRGPQHQDRPAPASLHGPTRAPLRSHGAARVRFAEVRPPAAG